MNVSAIPTAEELRGLAVLVPTYFRLEVADGEVHLIFHAPHRSPPLPLVTYAIAPAGQRDFAGPALARLVEYLAGAVMVTYRGLAASSAPALQRILEIANDPPLRANAQAVPGGELRASTKEIHTASADDWFPQD